MLSSRQKSPKTDSDKMQIIRFRKVHRLRRAGMSIKGIGERLKMSRMTVYKYLRFEEFPERSRPGERGSKLQPYLKYVHQRFAEGCQNATQLWREVVEQGYKGKPAMVRRYVRNLRQRITESESKNLKNKELKIDFAAPSVRKVAVLLMKKPETLKEEEKTFIEVLLSNNQEIEKIRKLGTEFQELIRERKAVQFEAWLESAAKSGITEMTGFAWGLKQDKEAVTASMQSEWSNGQVEGQVNRLKVIKRQMYGRGSFDLLKVRDMHQF